MISIGQLEGAFRNGLDAYRTARLSDKRGADLSQWGLLGSAMTRISRDATDKRRRLWRMKLPATFGALVAAVAVWVLLVRDYVPEGERDIFALLFFIIYAMADSALQLAARWRLDSRIVQARKVIATPVERQVDGGMELFKPAHVLTIDGTMVAAIDAERRLIRVIAPVFFGFDVVFRVDVQIRKVRLSEPKLIDLPTVAGMPRVTSDVQRASAFTIDVDGAPEVALFFVAEEDRPAAIGWTNVIQEWMQDDIAWRRNLTPAPVRTSAH